MILYVLFYYILLLSEKELKKNIIIENIGYEEYSILIINKLVRHI